MKDITLSLRVWKVLIETLWNVKEGIILESVLEGMAY